MMRDRKSLGGVSLAVTAVVGALTLGATLAANAPDTLLARSYSQSLDRVPTAWEQRLTGNLWLSHAPTAHAAKDTGAATAVQPLRQALSVGDQIKLSTRAGVEETIEVTSLEAFDGEAVGLSGLQLQVVTGKPVSGALGHSVRFLFAVDVPGAALPAKSDRSL